MKQNHFLMNASADLNFKNKSYKKAVELYVWQAYLNDLKKADVTTRSFLGRNNPMIIAKIKAKEAGIFAGVLEADWLLKKLKISHFKFNKKEGQSVKVGDIVMTIEGKAHSILAVERTLLNLLQRMSGIATLTAEMKSKMPKGIQLLATRKTFWGDLDKRAVAIGGGCTHRLNLRDAILIKENHIALCDDVEQALLNSFKKAKKVRFIEIELENLNQVEWLAGFLEHYDYPSNFVLMLDNFNPTNIKKAIQLLKPFKIIIEASGGIDINNIKSYCIKGISAISSGSIINKAKALDLSLRIGVK